MNKYRNRRISQIISDDKMIMENIKYDSVMDISRIRSQIENHNKTNSSTLSSSQNRTDLLSLDR